LGVKDEIGKDLIEELLGKINFDVLLNLLKNIYEENIELSLKAVDEIYAKGNEPRNLAENFIEFLRNVVLVLNSTNPENITKFTTLVSVDIEKIKACNFDKDKVIKILNTIIEYYKEIKISTNPYLWMELAALSSCRMDLKEVKTAPANVNVSNINPIQNAKMMALNAQAPTVKPIQEPIKAQQEEIKQEPKYNEVKPQEVKPAQPTQVPESVAQNQDGAQIWMNIVSAIQSLPTRAFYSGVAKLIGVQDKTIKLGFLHDNALMQAKSGMKLTMLENAINSTYQGYNVEFVKIDSTTKVIEVKPKVAPSAPTRPMERPVENNVSQNPIKQESAQQDEEEVEQTSASEKRQYSPKVRDMIEQFNGRIVD